MTSENRGRALVLAEQFRDELLARDGVALRRQARALVLVVRRLDERINDLAETLAQRARNGGRVTPGALVRLAEFRELRAQALAELRGYVGDSAAVIEAAQGTNVEAAIEETRALVAAQFPRGVTWAALAELGTTWATLDQSALSFMVGRLGDGSPLRAYLEARIVRGTIAQVVDALTTGIIDNPTVTARALRRQFAGGMTQALRISRTETLRSYRDAARASYQENPGLVRGYRRHAALDIRTCAACWLLDGTLYASQSDMEEHVQGRCYLSPVLVSWRELGFPGVPDVQQPPTGRERFDDMNEDEQRRLIGNNRQWELYRSGRIGVGDLIQRRVSRDFGAQLTQASAKASLAGDGTLARLPSTDHVDDLASLARPS